MGVGDKEDREEKPMNECMSMRGMARNILRGRMERSSKEAYAVSLLINIIPWEVLSAEQEELLDFFLVNFS